MKRFFGYVRVSTARQGTGVSLPEQRDAITRYAAKHGLQIVEWFEEQETAAKRGRRVFSRMLALLRKGKADGVICHKIDRSARNHRDWADLRTLVDEGVDVRFANEDLDLRTRGGSLSADIQAAIAVDYIRNLREEIRKGIYGRLKQKLYPLPAPVGYLDRGKGKRKEIDPVRGPLVRRAFEIYGLGGRSLDALLVEVHRLGLRNRRGGRVTRNGLSVILNNPFYTGVMRIRKTGQTFPGIHEPLVPVALFERVQRILRGKTNAKVRRHDFVFRRMLTCKRCGHVLTGELQKGRVYYYCHTKACPTTTVREDIVEATVQQLLGRLRFTEEERSYLGEKVTALRKEWKENRESVGASAQLRLDAAKSRFDRLTDAFLDGMIEKEAFERRKGGLLLERKDLEGQLADADRNAGTLPTRLAELFELATNALLSYENALPEEKRELVAAMTSNRTVDRKTLDLALSQPFREIAERHQSSNGAPHRDKFRTLDGLLAKVKAWLADHPESVPILKSGKHEDDLDVEMGGVAA